MVSLDFSPRVMPPSALKMPSSQPADRVSVQSPRTSLRVSSTLNDLAGTDLDIEVSTAYRRIEPGMESVQSCLSLANESMHNSLLALLLVGTWIMKPPRVLHGDLVALLRLIGAVTLLENLLLNTHCVGVALEYGTIC